MKRARRLPPQNRAERLLVWVPVCAGVPVWVAQGVRRNAWSQGRKLKHIASVEWQIIDLLLVDDLSDRRLLRLQLRRQRAHLDRVGNSADGQSNRTVRRLADFYVDRRNFGNLEACLLDTQLMVLACGGIFGIDQSPASFVVVLRCAPVPLLRAAERLLQGCWLRWHPSPCRRMLFVSLSSPAQRPHG